MEETLHILNGDSTLAGFKQTGLGGDVMVWREVLSEGPLMRNITGADFWAMRSDWIQQAFGDTAENYREKVINGLEKLSKPYQEIYLWFEFDLHCQVNLLGVMAMLVQHTDLSLPSVYLISPAEFPGKDDFAGMGELNADELEYLYDNAQVQLSDYDFKLAAEAWALYVDGDRAALSRWIDETPFWGGLVNLKPAMQAHLRRLTTDGQGLNYIHHKLLKIHRTGAKSREEIYREFWRTEKIYGMGDSELDVYLDQLITMGYLTL